MARDSETSRRRVVTLSPLAKDDQLAIYFYTAQQWGDQQAEDYLELLTSVVADLAENPALSRFVPNLRGVKTYLAKWPKAKRGHRIFFRETEDGIFVLRILHTSMNWMQHLDLVEES